MNKLVVGAWFGVNEGCAMRYSVSGSDVVHLYLGDNELQLDFDAASLRELVMLSAASLTEMDTRFADEEAERAAQALGSSTEMSA